jgi:hypothetical protein
MISKHIAADYQIVDQSFLRGKLDRSANCRCTKFMASETGRKLLQIDVSSDTVCPWCFVGKKNLERAMEQTKDKYNFEV